jgi:hypothetical protein
MEDLSTFNQADVTAAVAAAANVAASKVKIADVKFVVQLSYTFPIGNDVSGDLPKLKGAIAAPNGVFEYQVEIDQTSRRLSASMRQLSSATFAVTITSESADEAMSVKSSSTDNAALEASLADAGITTTQPTSTTPTTKVEVETDVIVGSDVDDAGMDTIASDLNSNLNTQLMANVAGASSVYSESAVKETSSPTAAPDGGGGGGSGGDGAVGATAGSGSPPSAVMGTSAFLAVLSVCVWPLLGAQ